MSLLNAVQPKEMRKLISSNIFLSAFDVQIKSTLLKSQAPSFASAQNFGTMLYGSSAIRAAEELTIVMKASVDQSFKNLH